MSLRPSFLPAVKRSAGVVLACVKGLAFSLSLACGPSFAQGYINAPIYATGYILAQPGTNVTTKVYNAVSPNNLNVLAGGTITNWTIVPPSPTFDGQILTIGCPNGNVASITIAPIAPTTVQSGGLSSCTSATSDIQYQYSFTLNSWMVLFGGTVTVSPNSITNADLAQAPAATIKGNPTSSLTNVTDFTIQGLLNAAAPSSTLDFLLLYNHATGVLNSVTPAALASAAGALTSVANSDGTLTFSTTGQAVIGSLNLSHANAWTAPQLLPGDTTSETSPGAGKIGEIVTASASAVALTNGIPANATSISLTAGHWSCWDYGTTVPAGTTTTSYFIVSLSTNSTPTINLGFGAQEEENSLSAGAAATLSSSPALFNFTTTTSVYLATQAGFSVSTMAMNGGIQCQRIF